MTGKGQLSQSFVRTATWQPHLRSWEGGGANPPGSNFQAHGRQEGDLEEPGQTMPDKPGCLLSHGQHESSRYHLCWPWQGLWCSIFTAKLVRHHLDQWTIRYMEDWTTELKGWWSAIENPTGHWLLVMSFRNQHLANALLSLYLRSAQQDSMPSQHVCGQR